MMRRILIILLFLEINLLASAKIYYVAPTGGSDSNPGTNINLPWATWQHAFETALAGDTVYFRGGVWYPASPAYGNNITQINPDDGTGHNGEPGNPICYFNYPGETPVLDCKNVRTTGNFISGLVMYDVHWINWRGLTIRNVYQRKQDIEPKGIAGYPVSNMTFENMVVHNIGGCGWYMHSSVGVKGAGFGWDARGYIPYDTIRYINCDTYQCCDTFRVNSGQTPGNLADGFKYIGYPGAYLTYEGCRAWHCADDGFDIPVSGSYLKVTNCWSFNHQYPGFGAGFEGNGFKLPGGYSEPMTNPYKIITNCIAAYCDLGIYIMNTEEYESIYRVYNNTMYNNKTGLSIRESVYHDMLQITFHNNIIYGTTGIDPAGRPSNVDSFNGYAESHNTWDYSLYGSLSRWIPTDTVTVTDDDFITVDSTGLTGARQADGSLPDLLFLKLDPASDLVNSATYVGLPYYDSGPDYGAYECDYEEGSFNRFPTVTITSPVTGSIFLQPTDVIITSDPYDKDGTISLVEFFNGTTKIGETTSPPWSFTWTNAPIGSHTINAVVTDNQGAKGTSSFIPLNVRSNNVVIYPNPNKGLFTLVLTEPLEMNCTIAISSYEGKAVYNGTMAAGEMTKEFNLANIPGESGTYVLVLSDREIILTKVFVIK
jgi:hypothetical protein